MTVILPGAPTAASAAMEAFSLRIAGIHQFRKPLQRIILALNGDQHRIAGAKTVDSQQIQRGRAVNEQIIAQRYQRCQDAAQAVFAPAQLHQLHHSTCQLRVGSNQVCVELGVNDGLPNVIIVDQAGVNVRCV